MDGATSANTGIAFPDDDPARQLAALRQDLESFRRVAPDGGMARLLAGRILELEEASVPGVTVTGRNPGGRGRRPGPR